MKYRIVQLPRIFYLYPTAFIALGLYCCIYFTSSDILRPCGIIFLTVFFCNLKGMAENIWSFRSLYFMVGRYCIFATILLLFLPQKWCRFPPDFYLLLGSILLGMMVTKYLTNRCSNVWMISDSRLSYKCGIIMYGIAEYPLLGVEIEKETNCVFKYLILRAGIVKIKLPGTTSSIDLEIAFANQVVRELSTRITTVNKNLKEA